MASDKKKTKTPAELKGLGEAIRTMDLSDKDAIVKTGIRLEQVYTDLRTGGMSKTDLNPVKQSLRSLQMLYQEQFSDPQAVWDAVADAMTALEEMLGGDDAAKERITSASAVMREALKRAAVEASEGAAKQDKTPEPEPAPELAPTPQDEGDGPTTLASMEDVAAKLVGADPTDEDQIASLRDALVAVTSAPTVAAAAVGHLTLAAQQLESILQGKASDPDAALGEAAKVLGQAAQLQERFEENVSGTGPVSEPEPEPEAQAAEPAAEEPAPAVEEAPAPPPAAPVEAPKAAAIEFDTPPVLPEDADADLLAEYIVESLDHITNSEGALLDIESNPEDREKIDVIFRAFHTIKGTSGFLGLDRIQKCAHLAENLLDRARDGQVKIMGGYADLALRSCDSLRTMIEGLQGVQPGGDLRIPDDLTELLNILSDPEAHGYSEQGAEASDANLRVGDILVAKGVASRRAVEKVEKTKGEKRLGEALVEQKVAKPEQVAGAMRVQKAVKTAGAQQAASVEATIRVGTSRLDSLINMVGELVIAQSMVAADPEVAAEANPRLQRSVSHAGKIIRELQDLTMSLRMVPLKGVFQKMNRLVRDLARKSGKKVEFICEGEDTEIDRNMVESLNDPLVHMIRNSVDHGVEASADRVAAGKSETGSVTLRAYHAAGNVVIEMVDDGKGLNREKIVAKAVERGIIEKNKEMSDQDVFMLIFAPGFSTADKITDVSGRGVGMDVVKRNIESLRGRIEVSSQAGKGTTFTVRLPLTMAIADAMILRVGQDRYLLPTVSIEQSFQPERGTVSTVTGKGEVVMLRGELLPLFRLHDLFHIDDGVREIYDGLLVVIEGDGRRCALMVDELLGQQQVVIKSLGQGMAKVPGISGGAILGDGRVGLILDAAGILELAEGRSHARDSEPAAVGAD